jgi:hypothetical protein
MPFSLNTKNWPEPYRKKMEASGNNDRSGAIPFSSNTKGWPEPYRKRWKQVVTMTGLEFFCSNTKGWPEPYRKRWKLVVKIPPSKETEALLSNHNVTRRI